MQPSVHDAFFKEMLSRPEHAASLLQQILPARVAARIQFDSLAPCAGSYVDEALKERHSDLLFSVPINGRPALIYILFEHQSLAGIRPDSSLSHGEATCLPAPRKGLPRGPTPPRLRARSTA